VSGRAIRNTALVVSQNRKLFTILSPLRSDSIAAALRAANGLEPVVADTSSIARQVLKLVESIKVVNGNSGHQLGLRQPQVDCYAASALLVRIKRSPVGYASALGAEVKPECLASNVCLGWTGHMNTFTFVVVGPEHPIAATGRAVASRRRLRDALEPPLNCAA